MAFGIRVGLGFRVGFGIRVGLRFRVGFGVRDRFGFRVAVSPCFADLRVYVGPCFRVAVGPCFAVGFRVDLGFRVDDGGSAMKAAALVVLVVAVAGCSPAADKTTAVSPVGGGVTGVPGETTSAPTLAAPRPAPTKAAPRRSPAKRLRIQLPSSGRFVAAVQRQMPQFVVDRRDDEVAELGEIACRSLAAGKPEPVVARAITEYGVGDRDARELVLLARDNACRRSAKS